LRLQRDHSMTNPGPPVLQETSMASTALYPASGKNGKFSGQYDLGRCQAATDDIVLVEA
jgi:hypothetical protein